MSQIDFTNPGAIQWYQTQLQSALNLKYKGWMYDFGEYTPHSSVNFINQTGKCMRGGKGGGVVRLPGVHTT